MTKPPGKCGNCGGAFVAYQTTMVIASQVEKTVLCGRCYERLSEIRWRRQRQWDVEDLATLARETP